MGEEFGDTNLKSFEWYLKIAEQGDDVAQSELGKMYALGKGVRKDYKEAVRWFRKAAEQGLKYAQADLGSMYAKGWGVPKDFIQAYMWYDLASKSGYDLARSNLGKLAKHMTRAQITKARQLAREWTAQSH